MRFERTRNGDDKSGEAGSWFARGVTALSGDDSEHSPWSKLIGWANTPAAQTVVARVGLLVVIILSIVLAFRLGGTRIPKTDDTSSVPDAVFFNGTLVLLIRIVLLFAGFFVIFSVAARIWNGHWLAKAGPFEVGQDAVDNLRNQGLGAAKLARSGADEIDELKQQLRASTELADELLAQVQRLEGLQSEHRSLWDRVRR